MPQINLSTALEDEQPKIVAAMRVALAAVQNGNTVDAEALAREFTRALKQEHHPWISAKDGEDVRG
ncbi:MAG TPA: hypothetical protein VGR35_21090 [Tepidisphaeraceae bacterium]|nr:hypothetical protein [Tepidisphaeraceae bacterium]